MEAMQQKFTVLEKAKATSVRTEQTAAIRAIS